MNNKFLNIGLGLGLTALVPGCQQTGSTGIDQRPNVVFIMIDDMGWSDVGNYGSSLYETPNIDHLATQGVKFTQAYATCSVCSPTRASLISGKYPARVHLTDWLPGRKDFPFQKLKHPLINQHLPYDITTLPEILKENGYSTAIFGKWHLGEDSASTERQGFDLHLPGWNKGWPNRTYFSPYNMEGLEGGPDGEYLTDRLTDEALKYMEAYRDKPFFIYLSHFAVHDPIMGRPDLVEKYDEKLAAQPVKEGPDFILEGNPDDPDPRTREELDELIKKEEFKYHRILPERTIKIKQKQDNSEFAAMVESVDESVGRVMARLEELGLEENTIVIFYSDNGGMSAANFGNPKNKVALNKDAYDKRYSTSNLPLRGAKGWFYEGGIRVPLIIKMPGSGLKNEICEIPVTTVDFFPTILEMIGIQNDPEKLGLDGKSLVPVITGKGTVGERPIFWHFPHYSNHGQQSPLGAVRFGDYKLIEYYENFNVQLFNLKEDPSEQNDISEAEPVKVSELRDLLHQWRKDVDAQMLDPNPDYDPTMSWVDYALMD
ncbi:MAG: sulfatase [Bacteroidales bacterium]